MRSPVRREGVRENVMFPPDSVRHGQRLMASQVNGIQGEEQPLASGGLHALLDEYTPTLEPTCALAAETLTLERKLKAEG